jgi:phage baseplate assembly protein W
MEKFLGLQYPLVKTARGLMANNSGVDQIKADLLQLLLTNPGERIMLPDFGTPLRKLIFEQNDASLEMMAKKMISESIAKWEPRIVISDISVTSKFDSSGLNHDDTGEEIDAILGIKISFIDPENISQVESLVLQVPFGG